MHNYNWKKTFLETPESFQSKINITLNSLPEKKEKKEMITLKRKSLKRGLVFAMVAVMALGITAFASGKIFSIISTGSSIADYKSLPSAEQINEDFGFVPKFVEKFDNGYIFDGGNINKCKMLDQGNNAMGHFKELDIDYVKAGDELYLNSHEVIEDEWYTPKTDAQDYKNVSLYYNSYQYKSVPADYKMTKQDKKDEESGKYVFSYGSDKEEVSEVKSVVWQENGISYCFLGIDTPLAKDELIRMTHQIIDAK